MEKGYIEIKVEEGKTPTVEAQLVNNNLWLTKSEMARLFNCFYMKIDANLRSIFKPHLLWEEDVSYTHRFTYKGKECQVEYFNLEVLIFLSYRIATHEAKIFRQFVNSSLREHLQKKKTAEKKIVWVFLPEQKNFWMN